MKLRVLIVDDDPDVRWSLAATCRDAGCEVLEADSLAAGRAQLEWEADVLLLDLMLPDGDGLTLLAEVKAQALPLEVIVMTGFATIERAVEAMQQGAFHFLAKPFSSEFLLTLLGRVQEQARLRYSAQQAALGGPHPDAAAAPRGRVMEEVETQVRQLADSPAKVLLLGPSGSGKTYYAQRIHELSGRRGNFVQLNCGAIPAGLIESELFGHEKGAFTDARTLKRGVFEQADGGTLLLDEIGDMPLDLQVRLLKVVDEGTITRVGAEKPLKVEVRLICATHRDLQALVRAGTFREDLWYRLNVFVIQIPALKERGYEDFLAIAALQLRLIAQQNNRPLPELDPKAAELLYLHPWPGNVRELRNVLERIVILEKGEAVTADMVRHHLFPATEHALPATADPSSFVLQAPLPPLSEVKIQYRKFVVAQCGGNLTEAARRLGESRKTLERERDAGNL